MIHIAELLKEKTIVLKKQLEEFKREDVIICPECENKYEIGTEPRVEAGLKCGFCAYGINKK